LAAGVNVKVVQERLGHFSPAFTLSIYAHATPDICSPKRRTRSPGSYSARAWSANRYMRPTVLSR
jgi:hypothetical protein